MTPVSPSQYAAFISYSHTDDARLGPLLKSPPTYPGGRCADPP
jgi:hypothetical protein